MTMTDDKGTVYATPIVVDLGKQKKKRIKKLKKGEGPLVEEVHEAVQAVLEHLGEDTQRDVVPVVVLYRKKQKKQKGGNFLFPFM